VLLVDDITDTGESMIEVLGYVKKEGVGEVKTATLQHIHGSKYEPDFYAQAIDWKWVIFPWNFHEDLISLVGKVMGEEEVTLNDIMARLKDVNSLEIEDLRLLGVLEDMEVKGLLKSLNRQNHIYWEKVGE
ncbi:MAG: phosphoribosyltransferase, partial [Thermoplasmata archaeon]|nr:phosphoribosyltransferase [Thermoplasmata archaeon]